MMVVLLVAITQQKKYGTPTNKVSLQTKSGAGNTMEVSELTGGVDMMGLLVFLIS